MNFQFDHSKNPSLYIAPEFSRVLRLQVREISERSVHPPVRKRIFHQGSNQPNILQRSKNERDFGLSRVPEALDQNLPNATTQNLTE